MCLAWAGLHFDIPVVTLLLQELLECLKELLRIDKSWLPDQEGYSMYIRPFAFSSAHSLGITKPSR